MVPPKDGVALVSINLLISFQSIIHKLQYYQNRKKKPFPHFVKFKHIPHFRASHYHNPKIQVLNQNVYQDV
jgi:hypothetical protein